MTYQYNFKDALAASERIHWRVEDLIGGDKRLDFSRPFMPESFARTETLTFLSAHQRQVLNQIRGHSYLYLFGLVEEFILPFVLDHARSQLSGDDYRVRALLQFAGEEAKHIHLFHRFREDFLAGFGMPIDVIGPPEAIARAVLDHEPLAVALVILHLEWMTQRHYLDSIRDDAGICPQFKSLLKHHWMEEAQHAKLDTLMVASLAEGQDQAALSRALDGYLDIGSILDGGLVQQLAFELDAFERATGRELSRLERSRTEAVQRQAMRWTFLGSGMTHPNFLASLDAMDPALRTRMESVAPAFC
ncbi:MAG: hypothetical protein GC201_14275 [Alphaproteobacteria bacterium]|nr:hypothetical protein [Alphaproteobacteria bacterium]